MRPLYHVFRNLTLEIVSSALAIGLTVAIAVLLASFDGKETPHWSGSFNLNAVLALLSTFLRALLVLLAARIVSQRKWSWFARNDVRPLLDLQKFDSGSRGGLGALLLVPTVLRRDPVTFVAAIVILSSFLVGPFVQQASRTVSCSFPRMGVNASIPFAHWVPRSGGYDLQFGSGIAMVADDLTIAVLSAITSPDGVENTITANCATGNCTFDDASISDAPYRDAADQSSTTHSTVGMCSMCTDITNLVTKNDSSFTYTLPNGYNFSSQGGFTMAIVKSTPDLDWMGDMLTTEARARARWAYVNATFLAQTSDLAFLATTCSLYPCLQTYKVAVVSGQLQEVLMGSDSMLIEYDGKGLDETMINTQLERLQETNTIPGEGWYSYNFTAIKTPCQTDGELSTTEMDLYNFTTDHYTKETVELPEHCIFRQDPRFVESLGSLLTYDIFIGYCGTYKGLKCGRDDGNNGARVGSLGAGAVAKILYNEGNTTYNSVRRYFDAVAKAMTNRLRFEYGSARPPANYTSGPSNEVLNVDLVQGTAWEATTCVAVHGAWLLLPICLTAITVLLCIWMISECWLHRYERPVWSDSILPYIFYGRRFELPDSSSLYQSDSADHEPDVLMRGKDTGPLLMSVSQMNNAAKGANVTFRWSNTRTLVNRNISQEQELQQESIPLRFSVQAKADRRDD